MKCELCGKQRREEVVVGKRRAGEELIETQCNIFMVHLKCFIKFLEESVILKKIEKDTIKSKTKFPGGRLRRIIR